MKRDRNNENENENDERDTSDNLKRKLEKIHQEERSIDTENNNQEGENDIKEKIIKRMIDTNYNTSSKTERHTKENTKGSSTENKTVYDLQTLLSQRQDRLTSLLYERYQYNTSIKRGQ